MMDILAILTVIACILAVVTLFFRRNPVALTLRVLFGIFIVVGSFVLSWWFSAASWGFFTVISFMTYLQYIDSPERKLKEILELQQKIELLQAQSDARETQRQLNTPKPKLSCVQCGIELAEGAAFCDQCGCVVQPVYTGNTIVFQRRGTDDRQ